MLLPKLGPCSARLSLDEGLHSDLGAVQRVIAVTVASWIRSARGSQQTYGEGPPRLLIHSDV